MHKTLYWLAGAILLVGGLGAFFVLHAAEPPQSAPRGAAAYAITWSTQALLIFGLPGDGREGQVVFRSDADWPNASLEIVPELARFVTVNATGPIRAGQNTTVRFRAAIPAATPLGTYTGTLHVKVQNKTIAQPLSVVVTVGVPPDPGRAGEATLEGIDVDNDGVRDDVQRFIAQKYPTSAEMRSAASQYARAAQQLLMAADNAAQAEVANANTMLAIDCVASLVGVEQVIAVTRDLRLELLDSEARTRAYLRANAQLGTRFYEVTPEEQRRAHCAVVPSQGQ